MDMLMGLARPPQRWTAAFDPNWESNSRDPNATWGRGLVRLVQSGNRWKGGSSIRSGELPQQP